MKVETTGLPGVLIIEPEVFGDERGFFLECYHENRYRDDAGIQEMFVQDNISRSARGVLRGLHFQTANPQGKLIGITHGEVFDVAVDINPDSATFKTWVGITLSDQNHLQLYVPPGYAHGFLVLSEFADFQYKCTEYYDPTSETGIIWNDPDIGIDWPINREPLVSARDTKLPTIRGHHLV